MDYRQLGRSGLRVSTLTLGTMTIGDARAVRLGRRRRPRRRTAPDRPVPGRRASTSSTPPTSTRPACRRRSSARRCVGRRDRVLLATKARMPMGEGPNDAGLSRHHLIEGCEASLRRLRTDHIDLYQVHEWDGQTPLEETLDTLDGLVRAGKVRYVGCSNYAAWQLVKALGISERLHLQRFVSQQIYYSLQAREAEYELVPAALDQGLGILVWSPLAGGLLSGKYRRDAEPEEGAPPHRLGRAARARPGAALRHRRRPRGDRRGATASRPPRSRSRTRSGKPGRDLAGHRRAHRGAARRQPRRGRPRARPPTSARGSTRPARRRCSIPTGTRPRRRRTASARPT